LQLHLIAEQATVDLERTVVSRLSPNIGGNNGTFFGAGMLPMGCRCLTMSEGRDKSNCAGGKWVWATSRADLLAIGARFFADAFFLLVAGAFSPGSVFLRGLCARYSRSVRGPPQASPPA